MNKLWSSKRTQDSRLHFFLYQALALHLKSTSSTGIGQSRVYNVDAILDQLLVITEEVYSNIRAEKTPQIKMRELLMGPMKSAGTKGKDALYKALKDIESCLIEDLERQWKRLDIFTFNVFYLAYLLSN